MNRNELTNHNFKEVSFEVHTITNFRVELRPATNAGSDVHVSVKFENDNAFFWTEYIFTVPSEEACHVYDMAELLMNHGYDSRTVGEMLALAFQTDVDVEDVCYRVKDFKRHFVVE